MWSRLASYIVVRYSNFPSTCLTFRSGAGECPCNSNLNAGRCELVALGTPSVGKPLPPPPAASMATLAEQVATLTDDVKVFKADLNAFYLMWAGARVVAALAPPLSHHQKGTWC